MGDGTKKSPYTREDVLRLIEENGGKAEGLDLSEKIFNEGIDLSKVILSKIRCNNAYLERANFSSAYLEGAVLIGAELNGAHLWNAHLEGATLQLSNLKGAKLWNANLRGADLLEANLEGADLWHANLEGADLDGVEFQRNTLLEEVHWGNYILSDEESGEKGCEEKAERRLLFTSAAATYRRLKIWYTEHGLYDIAGKFFYREMEAKRKSKSWKKEPLSKLLSWVMRILCGYGERPERAAVSAAAVILVAAFVYFLAGWLFEWSAFWRSLYFSTVSFTALGYGSWVNVNSDFIRGLGAAESFLGVFMMALFLVTFTRKMTR